MKSHVLLAAVCLIVAGSLVGIAAEKPQPKREDIKRLMELTGAGKLGIQVMNQMSGRHISSGSTSTTVSAKRHIGSRSEVTSRRRVRADAPLNGASNRAKDSGDIATLREIAEEPHGFILRQNWAALDFSEEVEGARDHFSLVTRQKL